MIKFTNVTKRYRGIVALDDISFELPDAGLIIIRGENGSGKSTMMNLIGALDRPILGTINIDGELISDMNEEELCTYREKNISFIFQDGNLFENLTVEENIKIVGSDSNYENIVSSLDLNVLLKKKAKELSGGEKARVGIARGLLKNSKIILADEPTAAIDADSKNVIFNILKSISKTRLVIVITHDQEMIEKHGDIVITIQKGKIIDIKKKLITLSENTAVAHKNAFSIKSFTKKNLFVNKKKIARNSIMLLLAFFFIILSTSLSSLDIDKMHSETMALEKEDTIYFDFSRYEEGRVSYELQDDDVEKLKRELNKDIDTVKTIEISGSRISLKLNLPDRFSFDNRYFSNFIPASEFLSIDACSEITYGTKPQNKNEIIINSYIAEAIIEYGIKDFDDNLYKPNDFEEVVNDHHKLNIGGVPVIITGITKINTEQFESIKTNTDNYLSSKFQDYLTLKGTHIYVRDDFYDLFTDYHASINENYHISLEPYDKDNQKPTGKDLNFKAFHDPVLLKHTYEKIENLEDDETIINGTTLNELEMSTDEVIGKEITLYFETNGKDVTTKEIKTFKVVGTSTDGSNYMSYNSIKKYLEKPIEITKLEIHETDKKEIEKILDNYTKNEYGYHASTVYTNRYNTIREKAYTISILAGILGIFFGILGALFSLNYILNSEEEHKRDIAILKALGIQNKKILATFALEISIIAIKGYIFSMMSFLLVRPMINYVTSLILAIKVNVTPISIPIMIIIIMSLLIFDMTISIISFYKIKRTTPQELFKINSI